MHRPLLHRQSRLLVLAAALLLFGGPLRPAHAEDKVLLLNSYHAGMRWVEDLTRGARDVLNPEQQDIEL